MSKEEIKYYFNTKKDSIILAILNTFVFWQLSYYIFILLDRQVFFDSTSYISMAKGNFNVIAMHAYRIAIPLISSLLAKFISIFNPQTFSNSLVNSDIDMRISFFLINLLFSGAIFYFLYETLISMKYRKIVVTAAIFSLQLNTIYLFYIAVPNVDIGVLFFLSLGLFVYSKLEKKSFFIIFLAINIIGSLFKEYIFITNLPILLLFLNEEKSKNLKKAILIFLYIATNLLFVYIFRLIISNVVFLIFETEFISTSSKPFFKYLIKSTFPLPFNINKLQDIFQYSPFLMVIIIILGALKNKNVFRQELKDIKAKNYLQNFNVFITLSIFLLLSGAATWSVRIFFPFYIYLLPIVCEVIEQITRKKIK